MEQQGKQNIPAIPIHKHGNIKLALPKAGSPSMVSIS